MNERELIWEIRSVVCSKCDGGSYDCYNCNVDEKLTKVLSRYNIEKDDEI